MRKATILAVLLAGCFGESDPIGGSGGGDDDTTASEEASSAASASETSVGSTSGASTTASTTASTSTGSTMTSASSTTDAGTGVDESESGEPPSCGGFGDACCDGACDEGACHRGRCVAFAGAYAEPMTCDGCTELPNGPNNEVPASTIPFLGACACPDGFGTSPGVPATSDYCPEDGVLHTPTDLRFCQVGSLPAESDWTGVYATTTSQSCGVGGAAGCLVPNPYTGDCACPDGSDEMVAHTWAPCDRDATSDDPIDIHVCISLGVPAVDFGGAFQTRWTQGGAICEAGNPRAQDACECPQGFVPEYLRITSPILDQGGDLALCVGY
jgi:hypothetical protein